MFLSRKYFVIAIATFAMVTLTLVVFGQRPSDSTSPTTAPGFQTPPPVTPAGASGFETPSPFTSPTSTPVLESTITPTPTPFSPTPTPGSSLTPESSPVLSPTPLTGATPDNIVRDPGGIPLPSAGNFGWSEKGAPTFTIDQAVLLALQQNPDVLRAKEEIKRNEGVILEVAAQALPHVTPNGTFNFTDPKLRVSDSSSTTFQAGGGGGGGGGSGNGPGINSGPHLTQYSYQINVTGSQLVANYSTFRQIRGTFFQRDSAYFAFRSTLDQVIATTKTQFYQVILNRALIGVQEESVRLLESQLKDQQNRFEAGTVPRFNVLQAQVQLSNQIPNLIAARNAYRISILTLAKTLGIDFNPARGIAAPLRVVGELVYFPRKVSLLESIELGKQARAFLKQARANVFNQVEQVHVALGGLFPNFGATGGYEVRSSVFNTSIDDVSRGWVFGMQGNWNLWDSGETFGRIKQQRALLSEAKITYDDDVRQVELEIQTAASNLLQNRELIQATEKNVEQADEAVRLAKARLDAGAGTQLDVLNAQVQLTTAQSTRLQALFGYASTLAEFDRVTGAQSNFTEMFDGIAPRASRSRRYYTGSDVDAVGNKKRKQVLSPGAVSTMSEETTTTTTRTTTSGK